MKMGRDMWGGGMCLQYRLFEFVSFPLFDSGDCPSIASSSFSPSFWLLHATH